MKSVAPFAAIARLFIVTLFLGVAKLHAADFYTVVTVVVTNQVAPGIKTNGTDTLTVNGDTRTGTNIIASNPSKLFYGTNSQTKATTNLYNHLALYPFGSGSTRLSLRWLYTNTFQLIGQINQTVTPSVGGVWGTVNATNYFVTNRTEMVYPASSVSLITQTNFGSAIVDYLNVAATFISQTAYGLSNYISLGQSQTFSNKTLTHSVLAGPNRITGTTNFTGTNIFGTNVTIHLVVITGGNYSGFISSLTNGTLYSNFVAFATLTNPAVLNLVNYGNAIRSEGTGGNSLQLGSNALARGDLSVAIGNGALASNTTTIAIGTDAKATNQYAMAIGNGAIASGDSSTAIGKGTTAEKVSSLAVGGAASAFGVGDSVFGTGAEGNGGNSLALGATATTGATNAMALGARSAAGHTNSAAFGADVQTTSHNQLRFGSTIHTSSIPGQVEVAGYFTAGVTRNLNGVGTNLINGVLALSGNTVGTVANGHNVIDVGTNTIIYLTGGPSAPWTLGGLTGAKNDGRLLRLVNQTGFDVTIFNESGTAPTASDRILTYASAGGVTNVLVTANGVMDFHHSTTAARWILDSPSVDVIANGTNGLNSIYTNGQPVTVAATSLGLVDNNLTAIRTTNAAGAVTMSFARPLMHATNFGSIFDDGNWIDMANEEWMSRPTSTAGVIGALAWHQIATGTLPGFQNPFPESNAWSYISMNTTQSTSGRLVLVPEGGGVPVGFALTNADYLAEFRVRLNSTNLSGDVCTSRIGLTDLNLGTGEAANGVYVMNNTNVNTNIWLLVTARGGSRTFTYSPSIPANTYGNMTWHTIMIYVPAPGNTAYAFIGPDRYRMTSFATNTTTLPGDTTQVGLTFQTDRIASTSGTNNRTNYNDRVRLWVRPYL